MISNCCNAEIISETDICSNCKEHSEDIKMEVFEKDLLIRENETDQYNELRSLTTVYAKMMADILNDVKGIYKEYGFEFDDEEQTKFMEEVEDNR